MTDDRDSQIRERAYALWEQEGRPDGRHEAHWLQAAQEADSGEARAPGGSGESAEATARGLQPGSGTKAAPATLGARQAR